MNKQEIINNLLQAQHNKQEADYFTGEAVKEVAGEGYFPTVVQAHDRYGNTSIVNFKWGQ